MIVNCIHCKKETKIPAYRSQSFKYCSRTCKHDAMKGRATWNKGVKYSEDLKKKLKMDGLLIGRGYFKGKITKINYRTIHYWVRTSKEYPDACSSCKKKSKRLEWSNVDHKYRLSLDDYIALCKPCHTKYDYENGLSDKGSGGGSIPNKVI